MSRKYPASIAKTLAAKQFGAMESPARELRMRGSPTRREAEESGCATDKVWPAEDFTKKDVEEKKGSTLYDWDVDSL